MSELSPEIDTSRPHSARMYDYLLGGKDHFATDREAADKLLTAFPSVRVATRENRAFLGRAVRYLAAEAGVRQFLDIGAGLPSASNVHEIAQGTTPSSRVVYVDNDPLVLAHARALLASGPEGRTVTSPGWRSPALIWYRPGWCLSGSGGEMTRNPIPRRPRWDGMAALPGRRPPSVVER